MHEEILPLVQKPARYINSEINTVRKDLSTVKTRFCLFFPDAYEVGMSHLGFRILYDILNKRDDTACERVFSVWTDYEELLRKTGQPLISLESGLPLSAFDIIGISLQYELSYTNILAGLELGRVPLHSADRSDAHPVVVAGGPCAVNPEPLAEFVDVFFIGEAEDAVHELVDLKQKHSRRGDFLKAIARQEGFYVPAFGRGTVRRRYVRDIDTAPYPERPLLPLLKPIHDRISVEVARGCIRGCRFCQAGIIYRPMRERSASRVRNILRESLNCTGYEELSLASLSSGDYSAIEPLIVELMESFRDSRVSVSLPSLRVGTLTPGMIAAIAGTRKTGFTFAPEAGTERLRAVINKPVSDRELLDAASTIFASGWNVLKLYFMIGLPTETELDLDGIIRLGSELLHLGKSRAKRHVQINISVSTFVPKPHTPFQWFGQASAGEIRQKQAYLARGLRKRGINLKLHDPETSQLEASFARGDRELGRVIETAFRKGCRFDGWSECFDYRKWEEAFKECGLDPGDCAARTFSTEEPLPWDHVNVGVTKKFLAGELQRSQAAEVTGNCRSECVRCGIGCADGGTQGLGVPTAGDGPGASSFSSNTKPVTTGMTTRVRIKYQKVGRLRFLSHLDFMTLFHRTAVRAQVPIAFSQGFNPHPKVAFGPALPVGVEGEAEHLDMEIDPFFDAAHIKEKMNRALPRGIRILESSSVPRSAPSLSGSISRYDYRVSVPDPFCEGLRDRVAAFLSLQTVLVARGEKRQDIRECIETMTVAETRERELLVTLQDKREIRPRIQDVIAQCFGIGHREAACFRISRTAMYFWSQNSWRDPIAFR